MGRSRAGGRKEGERWQSDERMMKKSKIKQVRTGEGASSECSIQGTIHMELKMHSQDPD